MVVNGLLAGLGSKRALYEFADGVWVWVELAYVKWFGRPHFPGASRQFGATQGSTRAAVVARGVRTGPVASPHS